MQVRTLLAVWGSVYLLFFACSPARTENTPGNEIVVGNVLAPSADNYAATSLRVANAYFRMVNSAGGIRGRQIRLVSYDAKGDLKRTLDLTRQLVEKDNATLLYQMDSAAEGNRPYVLLMGIPQVFDARPAAKPGTDGIPALSQGRALGEAINALMPDTAIALLYREDMFSNAALTGLYEGMGADNARLKIKNRDEARDPVKSIAKMAPEKRDVLVVLGDLELQRKVLSELDKASWRPVTFMSGAAVSLRKDELEIPAEVITIASRMARGPVGEEEERDWENFRSRYLPGEEPNSNAAFEGYLQARDLVTLLEICGDDRKCLVDRYRSSPSRWIAQAVAFEQGSWKSIGRATTENTPGNEIIVGNVLAPSADNYAATSLRVANAYFRMVNSAGGIRGRQIRLVSYDAKGDLKRTLDLTRQLVEKDNATLLYQMDSAAEGNRPYVLLKRIPQVFDARPAVGSGASGVPAQLQGDALGRAIKELMPDASISLIYLEDEFSNAALTGLYRGLGYDYSRSKIKHRDEATDPAASVAKMAPYKDDVLIVFGGLELQRKVLRQLDKASWWPVTFMTDAAVYLGKEELEIPGAVVSVESRMARDHASEEEIAGWESFRSGHLPVEDARSKAAFEGYLQARDLVKLLETCGEDRKCLIDRYRSSASRWIAQTITFEQDAWKPVGPQGLTVFQ
jgi:branched-chain amino acid transport system substrate-binding protein